MIESLLYALLTALSAWALMLKAGRPALRKLLGYELGIDVAFTIILWVTHSGSTLGLIVAAIGGLFFSILLKLTRLRIGWARLTMFGWEYYPPKWK